MYAIWSGNIAHIMVGSPQDYLPFLHSFLFGKLAQ